MNRNEVVGFKTVKKLVQKIVWIVADNHQQVAKVVLINIA